MPVALSTTARGGLDSQPDNYSDLHLAQTAISNVAVLRSSECGANRPIESRARAQCSLHYFLSRTRSVCGFNVCTNRCLFLHDIASLNDAISCKDQAYGILIISFFIHIKARVCYRNRLNSEFIY